MTLTAALISIFLTSMLLWIFPTFAVWLALLSLLSLSILLYMQRQNLFKPRSKTYKEIERLKKVRQKKERSKEQVLIDQLEYIRKHWGLTQEQERLFSKYMEHKAYELLYNKLTAAYLPQLILLIDQCNEKNKKGCKRHIGKRLNVLKELIKEELNRTQENRSEKFEIDLEVYDRLLLENS